ncbi:MAG: methyltransferase domain-containing protein [Anaerolineae bacterium]|nr:methyltransferase domain-containing protein [Anaerolineae bacterium]
MLITRNWLVYHIHDKALGHAIEMYVSGRIVDIGCGTKPYKKLLSPYVSDHIGIDHRATEHDISNVDIFCTAYRIPVTAESFDSAICTAVLEHLEEPENALRECLRVLKPGGHAVYSIPFIWHLHEEPRDFYRYSKYGIQYLFEKAGFQIVELIALSGFWVTFGQLLVYNIYRFKRGPLKWIPIIDVIGLFIQGFSYLLDKIDKSEKWTWMYMVVAKKL